MTEPLNLDALNVTNAEAPTPKHVVPDHKAGTKKRGSKLFTKDEQKEPKVKVIKPKPDHEPPSKPGEFVKPLTEIYRAGAVMLLPISPHVAMSILEIDEDEESPNRGKDRATVCAESLDEAAQKSDGLRRTLRMITKGGTWGKVVMAHMPILLAVLANHTPLLDRLGLSQKEND